jgi:hypothetical protein
MFFLDSDLRYKYIGQINDTVCIIWQHCNRASMLDFDHCFMCILADFIPVYFCLG